jgi:hypothetical protein
MSLMLNPIPRIPFSQFHVMDHEQVSNIILLSGFNEIDTLRDQGFSLGIYLKARIALLNPFQFTPNPFPMT